MEAEVPRHLRRDSGPDGPLIVVVSRRAAVLGSPIGHSKSPVLHRAAYAALGLDWRYDAIEMTSDRLPAFLASCSWPEWAGLSLTMPLKFDVIPLLDEISPTAEQVQATNTVVFSDSGASGYNTDVAGMRQAIVEAGGGELEARTAVIVGAGATARSALAALAGMGVTDSRVVARSREKASALEPLAADLAMGIEVAPWQPGARLDADIVISTVPPGVADEFAAGVPTAPGVLLDVAYGDSPTALTRAWTSAGGRAADGLDLLLWQAADQVTLMTGLEAPVAEMRSAVRPSKGATA